MKKVFITTTLLAFSTLSQAGYNCEVGEVSLVGSQASVTALCTTVSANEYIEEVNLRSEVMGVLAHALDSVCHRGGSINYNVGAAQSDPIESSYIHRMFGSASVDCK